MYTSHTAVLRYIVPPAVHRSLFTDKCSLFLAVSSFSFRSLFHFMALVFYQFGESHSTKSPFIWTSMQLLDVNTFEFKDRFETIDFQIVRYSHTDGARTKSHIKTF